MHARESLLRVKLIGYNKQTQFNEVDLDQSCLLRFVPPARCCCTRPMSNSVGMPRTTLYMSENAWFLFSKMCKPAKISLPIHSNAKGIIISDLSKYTNLICGVAVVSSFIKMKLENLQAGNVRFVLDSIHSQQRKYILRHITV